MKKVSDIVKDKSDKLLKKSLDDNSGLFLFGYSGINSVDLTKLRRQLSSVGANFFVTKNSFINVAFKKKELSKDILSFVDGPTALVFIKEDPVGPSKVLTDFIKTHETAQLRGGYFLERLIYKQDFKVLSNIPSKHFLYQQIATAFNAPVSKLAMTLNQIVAKIAYALKAVSDKKSEKKSNEGITYGMECPPKLP